MRVFVTGIGIVSPAGVGRPDFWAAVKRGVGRVSPSAARASWQKYGYETVGEIAGFDVEKVVPGIDSRRMPLIAQFSCGAAQLALADGRLAPADGRVADTTEREGLALCLASTHGSCEYSVQFHDGLFDYGPGKTSAMLFSSSTYNAALSAVSMTFGITGRCLSLAGGRGAGVDAIGLAYELLRAGAAPIALAGGAEELSEVYLAAYSRLGMLEGRMPTEGACLLLLESADSLARRNVRPLCEIVEYASRKAGDEAGNLDGLETSRPPDEGSQAHVSFVSSFPPACGGTKGGLTVASTAPPQPSPQAGRGQELQRLDVVATYKRDVHPGTRKPLILETAHLLGEGFAMSSAASVAVAALCLSDGAVPAALAPPAEKAEGNMAAEKMALAAKGGGMGILPMILHGRDARATGVEDRVVCKRALESERGGGHMAGKNALTSLSVICPTSHVRLCVV